MISVIIPVYNVEEYLRECVDSVLAQTYTDWEAILVDDGSTDSSGAICDEYAAKDERIRVIHQANQGLSGARNTALDAMKGDYVTFLDSDDYILPGALEHLLNLCLENNAEMSVCQVLRLESDGTLKLQAGLAPISGTEVLDGVEKMRSYIPLNKQTNSVCGKLYHRELFCDIRFPLGKTSEDVFVSYQVIHAAKRMAMNKNPQYVYRNRPGSIMTRCITLKDFDVLEGRVLEQEFFAKHYPMLLKYTRTKTCAAALTLIFRTAADHFSDPKIDKMLKETVRKYLPDFLRSKHKRSRKLWAILSVCSLRLTRVCVRLYRKRVK